MFDRWKDIAVMPVKELVLAYVPFPNLQIKGENWTGRSNLVMTNENWELVKTCTFWDSVMYRFWPITFWDRKSAGVKDELHVTLCFLSLMFLKILTNSLSRICLIIPTSSSSSLWLKVADTSMYLQRKRTAAALPSVTTNVKGTNSVNYRLSHHSRTGRSLYHNKKAVLSQRRPRDAPYIWVPWKFWDSLYTPP